MDNVIANSANNADLVERIRAGDRQAEGELFRRYKRGVSTILQKWGVSDDIIDDLFQETIIIVLQKIKQGDVRDPDRLSGFVCGVARNRGIKHFEKESRMCPMTAAHLNTPLPPCQHEELSRKEDAQMVRRVMSELKVDRDRQILFRLYLLEEDKEKICNDLALSSLHFNRVLHRAHQRFKEMYESAKRKLIRRNGGQ